MNEIALANATTLAGLSTAFCELNGLEVNDELARVISLAVNANIARWYDDNGKTYNPTAELIEEEAIKYAFGRLQAIAMLAAMAANAGIDPSSIQ